MTLEGLCDQMLLRWSVNQVKHELDSVCALLVAADLDKIVLDHS